jgi:hypothetical protein
VYKERCVFLLCRPALTLLMWLKTLFLVALVWLLGCLCDEIAYIRIRTRSTLIHVDWKASIVCRRIGIAIAIEESKEFSLLSLVIDRFP